jgi:hypothetical protein
MNQNTGWSRLAQGQRAGLAVAAMALSVFLTGFSLNPFSNSTPVLLLLEHTEAGKQIQTKIELKDGLVTSPEKGKPQTKWIIRAGDALKSEVHPGDRSVNFYQATGAENTLLFVVKVRYYQNATGVPSLIVRTGTALPNAEGYFPSLEFGMTTGATSIDAWLVQ